MIDFLAAAIVACLVVGIVLYLRREKKKGKKCIGCPYGGQCGKCDKRSDKR